MAVNQNIEVYIDQLVLHGFSPHQHHDIAAALEAELTRLIAERGIPHGLQSKGNIPVMNAANFSINKNSKGKSIGNKIAGSVYKSLGK
jgi:hypothetical protein